MKCPCEECLKLPICKSKEIINCSDFADYSDSIEFDETYLNRDIVYNHFDILKQTLPNITCLVAIDKGKYDI